MRDGVPEPPCREHRRTTVLIVDDDPDFGRAAAELLEERGYAVVGHAKTVREAAAACNRLDPDAVLLDVRLPDGNGIAFAQSLGAARDRLRILLTSNDRMAVGPAQLRASGAAGFVPKTRLARSDLDRYLQP